MTSFIICVWMLLPIAHSHDVETLFGSAFESGITAAVSIFTIKLSLYLTNLVTDTIIGVVTSFLPFEIPERLLQIASAVINFGAEVFLWLCCSVTPGHEHAAVHAIVIPLYF